MRLDGFPWAQYGSISATVSRVATEIRDGAVRVEFTPARVGNPADIMQHGVPGVIEVAVEQAAPGHPRSSRRRPAAVGYHAPGHRQFGRGGAVNEPKRRKFLVPEVVQTSAMDCGPAALKCLLEGFGIPVSYGRLREACQTDVDGTSIDTIEVVANQLGVNAEQMMLPVDHLFLNGTSALPALIVVRHPSGGTHFVVIWRQLAGWLQLMDPAIGRRWVRRAAFMDEIYRHATACRRG